jgi:hypothetical protein
MVQRHARADSFTEVEGATASASSNVLQIHASSAYTKPVLRYRNGRPQGIAFSNCPNHIKLSTGWKPISEEKMVRFGATSEAV